MRYAMALMLAVLAAGCGDRAAIPAARPKDPATCRLETGTEVITYEMADIASPDGRKWRKGDEEFVVGWLDVGARVIVLDDRGDEADRDREVRATVQDGDYRGRTYLMGRRHLRPLLEPR